MKRAVLVDVGEVEREIWPSCYLREGDACHSVHYWSNKAHCFLLFFPCVEVPDDEADVCVLEEPEHLNFFRAEGVPWLKKFE